MQQSEYRIYPEASLGVVWLRGVATSEALSQYINRLYSDGRWQAGYVTLWDLRSVSQLLIAPADISAIMGTLRSLAETRGTGKLAFVVGRDLEWATFTLLTYKDWPISKRPSAMFWDINEALGWLGVTNPPADLSLDV